MAIKRLRTPDSKRERRFAATVALIVICIPLLVLSVLVYGRGGRTFFSPDTLENRSQGEYRIPIISVPVLRLPNSYYRYELTDYLIAEGYWSPSVTDHPRWQLVNHWNKDWRDGHSELHKQFGWNSKHWIEWTKNHPEIAEIMWPELLRALRDDSPNSNHAVPDMLFSAEHAETLAEYEANLELP